MAIEINGWVGNLGKYNEGFLINEYVAFPMDEDDWEKVLERIGINERYEEYFFPAYDSALPLHDMFGEFPSYEDLNDFALRIEDADEDILSAILSEYTSNVEYALDVYESGDWVLWDSCNDMGDVAYRVVQELPDFYEASDFMQSYFDYESFGRDLRIESSFIPCCDGFLQII